MSKLSSHIEEAIMRDEIQTDMLTTPIDHVIADQLDATGQIWVSDYVLGKVAFEDYENYPYDTSLEPVVNISLESFSSRVAEIWKKINDFLKRIGKWIRKVGNSTWLVSRAVNREAKNLQVLAPSRFGMVTSKKPLEVRMGTRFLSVRYRPIQDISNYISASNVLLSQHKAYFDYIEKTLIPGINGIATAVRNLNLDDLDREISRLETMVHHISPVAYQKSSRMSVIPGFQDKWGGTQLLGDRRMVVTMPIDYPRTLSLHDANQVSLKLQHAERSPKKPVDVVEIPRFDRVIFKQAIANVIALSDLVQTKMSPEIRRKNERVLENLEASFKRLSDSLQSSESDVNLQSITPILRLSKTLTGWLTDPYVGVCGETISIARAGLMLCRQNLMN